MFAIYEVCDKSPSGKPPGAWADWTTRDGAICEKRLLATRATRDEADALFPAKQTQIGNTVLVQEIP